MSTVSFKSTPAARERLTLKNELDKSRSPYVRGHMNNPVAWQEWKPETLELAKKHDRLLFVSVGYAACHWCHVMEHESFEDDQIADMLNEHFIPIKIDREERPDIDRVYMTYVQATMGRGGWPMNVFLTPDLEPIFGGTYFPGPDTEMAKAGATNFLDLLKRIQTMWDTQRDRCILSAKDVSGKLREFAQASSEKAAATAQDGGESNLDLELLEEAYTHFENKFDPEFGGFGGAPKFPTPPNLSFLLSLGAFPTEAKDVVGQADCEKGKQMALTTLRYMTRGGINDQIGNGFARYSVTQDWSLPHFEKMLYDQPQLLSLYLDAFLLTGDPEMLGTVYSISSYLTSPPLHASAGGFFSSEDADSFPHPSSTSKREGGFYVWTRKELTDILGSKDAAIAAKFYNVHEDGNVDPQHDAHNELEGQNILAITSTPDQLSAEMDISKEQVVKILKDSKAKLLEHRDKKRPRPDLDDKIVAGWNGLAIGALSRTSSVLEGVDSAKAKECRDAAMKALDFLKRELFNEQTGEMKRVFREGPGDAPAFADDYAYVIQGCIELYEATFDDQYLQFADRLQKMQISLFHDTTAGGFYSTSPTQSDLLLPTLKDSNDGAEPSTNGITALNLFRLASFFSDDSYRQIARRTIAAFEAEIVEHPFLFASLLNAIVWERLGGREVTVVGEGEELERSVAVLRSRLKASTTVTRLGGSAKSEWLVGRNELLKGMDQGKKMVQVCENMECRIVGTEQLEKEIDGRSITLEGV